MGNVGRTAFVDSNATTHPQHRGMGEDLRHQADELLRRNRFCVLATSTLGGQPWATPLFFNYSSDYTLVWESAKDAHHSGLLRANPHAAIVVTDDDELMALYIECLAVEAEGDGIAVALHHLKHGPHRKSEHADRTPADYLGAKPLRLYTARPVATSIMTRRRLVDGYLVDERVPIDLLGSVTSTRQT
jgi:hypothetical protein